MHERLTEARIASLNPGPGRSRMEVADGGCSGLWLRVTREGVKTFAVRFRSNGKPARYTIGRYPSVTLSKARSEAIALFDKIRKGEDPRHRKWDAATVGKFITVEYVVSEYLERLGRRNRGRRLKASHVAEVRRRFKTEVLPAIGGRSLETVSRDTIVRLLDRIEDRATRVAGHVFYDMRVFYKWAIQQGYIASSPMEGLDPPAKPEARERVLTIEELRRIWAACSATATAYNTIIRLLILTAQRRGEVTGAQWTEFDLDGGLWTIPRARTKNGREHRVPLSPAAIAVLEEWRAATAPGLYLFPSSGTTRPTFSGFSRCKRRLDASAGVTSWTVHDLRRTTATSMAEMGVAPHVIERILNHVNGSMSPIARVYNRYAYEVEMRQALDDWPSNVIREGAYTKP